jgi:1-deoxy-D-xylulose-5-phosphate reductoisomerase
MVKKIAIFGSTGSIGVQALEVIKENSDKFQVEILVANNSDELLVQQALEFNPNIVVIGNQDKYETVCEQLKDTDIKVYAGEEAITQVGSHSETDIVLASIVGFAGLRPTVEAIKAGKTIALANKETLVVAGQIIQDLCKQYKSSIIPVDSEHSAIFQCLVGEFEDSVEKIILTASGGPFKNFTEEEFKTVTVEQSLKHPNWEMGKKITIDSATMINKCLEVIEAKWLFNLRPEQIDVVVHPQSYVHSFVQYVDSSLKAQIGLPDMKLPIQYAFTFPDRLDNNFERLDLLKHNVFNFQELNPIHKQAIDFAKEALAKGGNLACILNAGNEIAIEKFFNKDITFLQIYDLVRDAMDNIDFIQNPSLEDLYQTDFNTRNYLNNKY